jgi:pilus assembly protein CpaD
MIKGARKDSMNMARFRTSAALVMAGVALAGCGVTMGPSKVQGPSNMSLYSENQPVVEHSYFAFDLATTGNGVSSSELARLAAWFDTLDLRYGDRIGVDDPYGRSGVIADVARVAADYGLLLSDGVPPAMGSAQSGSARVVVTRATASVPGCPNWRQAKLSGGQISTDSNFGCATNSNLAAMIANPDDLVLGQQGVATGDAMTSTKAIKAYRDKAPTGAGGLEAVSTK